MANYVKSTNFAIKDGLTSGNPSKIIKGTEINTELENIEDAIASKPDANNGIHTGTTSVVNLDISGTVTGTIDGGTY
jgi:hypothetical protein